MGPTLPATPLRGLSPGRRIGAIATGSIGNLVEWYDFYVYAFTALYFSKAFFPAGDRLAQVMATSGIFAVGFLLRPIGGWYFGRYADRRGRSRAMLVSVLLMGAGSLLIALLPTYAQAGAAAPALLLVGRMVQGFSTGGQYGTAATYMSEVAIARRRGFYASFQYVTLVGGQLLATAVVLLLQQLLTAEAMTAYGWRLAFAGGAVGAAAFALLRGGMPETIAPGAATADAGRLRDLRPHLPALLVVLGLTAGGSLSFYTFTTYMQKYLVLTAGMPVPRATAIMTAVLVPFMLAQPLFGLLADVIGRRTNLLLFGALATGLTVPLLAAIGRVQSGGAAFALVLAGLLVCSFYTSISGLFKAELFPARVRALGVGLSYGVGNALFGGTAENVALAFKHGGREGAFGWYVAGICAVSLVTAALMRETRRASAIEDAAP